MPRHRSVEEQAAYCRDEALRMRAAADRYAALGDIERARMALVVAREAEAFYERLAGEPAVIDAEPRRAVG